jgi:hypothetical protein
MRSIAAYSQIPLFIAKYGQPDVAFSFVDLLGTDHTDIISLRDSDDAEESFKLSEIRSGVYQNWVNEETTFIDEDFSSATGWNFSSGVSISGGSLNYVSAGNSGFSAFKTFGSLPLQTVRITIVVSNYVEGELNAIIFSSSTETTPRISANGTYTYIVTIGAGTSGFWGFRSSDGPTTLKVDSFKVDQLTANGLVKTKYSQGNAVTLQQSAASKMPILVKNGVLQLENGLPIMRRNGADGGMLIDYDVDDAVARSLFYVGKNPLQSFALLGSATGGQDYGYNADNGSSSTNINARLVPTSQRLNLATWNPSNRGDVYANLLNQFLVVVECTFNYDVTGLTLGYRFNAPVSFGMPDFQQLIIYPGNTDNAEKEAYINKAYSIINLTAIEYIETTTTASYSGGSLACAHITFEALKAIA